MPLKLLQYTDYKPLTASTRSRTSDGPVLLYFSKAAVLMGHIYISRDAADTGTSTSAGPAAGSSQFAHCCSQARVSYDESSPCYVFKAIRSSNGCSVAAALSSNSIKLYNCSAHALSHAGDIPAHQDTISDLQFPFPWRSPSFVQLQQRWLRQRLGPSH